VSGFVRVQDGPNRLIIIRLIIRASYLAISGLAVGARLEIQLQIRDTLSHCPSRIS
jgi:hypothetical protein